MGSCSLPYVTFTSRCCECTFQRHRSNFPLPGLGAHLQVSVSSFGRETLIRVDAMHPRYPRYRGPRSQRLLDDARLLLARSIMSFTRTGYNRAGGRRLQNSPSWTRPLRRAPKKQNAYPKTLRQDGPFGHKNGRTAECVSEYSVFRFS
jgi:hypothetical protein